MAQRYLHGLRRYPPPARNVCWHDGNIDRAARWRRAAPTRPTIWFTGLSGSGKSTIAAAVEEQLIASGAGLTGSTATTSVTASAATSASAARTARRTCAASPSRGAVRRRRHRRARFPRVPLHRRSPPRARTARARGSDIHRGIHAQHKPRGMRTPRCQGPLPAGPQRHAHRSDRGRRTLRAARSTRPRADREPRHHRRHRARARDRAAGQAIPPETPTAWLGSDLRDHTAVAARMNRREREAGVSIIGAESKRTGSPEWHDWSC